MSTPQQITVAVDEPTPKQSGGKPEAYPRTPGAKKEAVRGYGSPGLYRHQRKRAGVGTPTWLPDS